MVRRDAAPHLLQQRLHDVIIVRFLIAKFFGLP
jgi:hypothetical protein